jgi:hypothetical protein
MESQNDQQVFRYWVELRELASGTVRKLSLTAVTKISLARQKKNESPPLRQTVLRLHDGAESLEASNLDELAVRLRDKYPDRAFERTLHYERDRDSEERRERAMNGLIDLLAQTVVREMIGDKAGGRSVGPRD